MKREIIKGKKNGSDNLMVSAINLFKSGVTHVNQRQGLLMIEMMNATGVNYPRSNL